jgi:tRNA (guanine26-N2/guanine27-N2)-dimethyltransferase
MKVFYNPKMEINRDISCLAVNSYANLYDQKYLIIVDSMAASGISAIRMIKECDNVKRIYINDINPYAIDLIHKNIELNKLKNEKPEIIISQKDANFLLSEIEQNTCPRLNISHEKPNVISIDPFGTPNLYLDSAFKAIQRNSGLICITATDTAVLFGIRPKACIRKYMAKPLHTEYCKEIGARILVYFISRIANINKLGILPLLTFYSNHFTRVFALTIKDKREISKNFINYGFIIHCYNCESRTIIQNNILNLPHECPNCSNSEKLNYAGPLWVGKIHEPSFVEELLSLNSKFDYVNKKKIDKILTLIQNEIDMPISYLNIHKLCQKLKLSNVPRMDKILDLIKERDFKASRTHFDFTSIKTDINLELLKKLLLERYG